MIGITFLISLLHAFVVYGAISDSRLELYRDYNLTDLILESSSTLTCNNVPGNSSIQVASLKAYSCWILYGHSHCLSTWSDKADDEISRLRSGATWTIGSFHSCNENVGGNQLNLDITEYFSPILPVSSPKVLESYRDVCTCINVPDYVHKLGKWSINNHGNDLIAYFDLNCGQTKWKPKYLAAGINEDCRNIYNESRIDHTCLCPSKIMSFGPYVYSTYFKTSCRYSKVMEFETFEIRHNYTKPSSQLGALDISLQGMRSQIDFFSGQSYTGSHLRLELTENCSELPNDLWKGYEVRSVNAKYCVMLYSEHRCRGRSIKLGTGKSANLNVKWIETIIGLLTFLDLFLYFRKWQWETKSFHACNYNEGGPPLNIDITPYFPDKEQPSHAIVLYSYKNIISCQNVPQDVYTMNKWSTNNHGNGFVAYFEPSCKSKSYDPVWIPPGRNSFSMGIGLLRRTNNVTGQIFKIKSFSSVNFTTDNDEPIKNFPKSTTEANILENVTETLPIYIRIPNKHIDEPTKSETSIWTYVGISVGVLFALIFSATLAIHWVRLSRMQDLLSPDEVKQFLSGNYKKTRKLSQNEMQVDQTTTEKNALEKPYDSSLEIPKKNYEIVWSSPLGSGEFGSVYKAFVTLAGSNEKIQVALKMTKDNCPKSAVMSILGEIKILSYLGQHANLVCVKGAYTAEISRGVVYVATEICELGSIKDYLKNKEIAENSRDRGNIYENNSLRPSVDFGTMVRWSYEIASGMEYLDEKHVIHADVAARNILLTGDKTAKISDFGLSRRLYEYTNYVKRNQEPLPWRWMAVEALKKLEFSSQSDVWSYGVTLWEIFSMGDIPFPGHSWTMDFLSSLESGLRMKCPPHATPEIYKLMTSCWQNLPQDRPTFSELKQSFAGMQEKKEETRRIRARYAMSCI